MNPLKIFSLPLTILFTLLLIFQSYQLGYSQQLGIFDHSIDIGDPTAEGTAKYDAEEQMYKISSGEVGNTQFLTRKASGNFILRARIISNEDNDGIAGWSIRNSIDLGSDYVNTVTENGGGLTSLQYSQNGEQSKQINMDLPFADVIQIQRKGDRYILSAARFGQPFQSIEISDIELNDEVHVGLYATSENDNENVTAEFMNVRITTPVDDDYVPYQEYIGSRLETVHVETGHRHVLHQENRSLQAPNWTVDGKTLIYNADGLLYYFDLETKTPSVMDTGFATSNNNDHVISFDGTKMGISHHSEDHNGQSIIYTLPIEGGTPQLVTDKGPSYLHGWSAGDDTLTYTGGRNGQFDIYKISEDGGEEVQLTDTPALDDGSEYTPDGKYIYFNSNRTDTMQIWRMRPDGSQPEQLTFDEYQDWFPHISPDGKTVLFLSYMPEVPSGDHPFYKQVYLRKMPLDGGEPEVVAYLYGGQGTINVPSWSPDSKKVSFVSNTQMDDE